jgi:hypothetical protein
LRAALRIAPSRAAPPRRDSESPISSEDVVAIDGARVIPLPRLIELKLVSGTSAPGSRRKDLADVYALIAANRLPREYAYCKIWDDWQESRKWGGWFGPMKRGARARAPGQRALKDSNHCTWRP